MHEISGERRSVGTPAYEAIVYLVHDPHTDQHGALWLDNTHYNTLLPAGQGHGVAAGIRSRLSLPIRRPDRGRTTFVYDRATDRWSCNIESEDSRGRRPFARVQLTRH